jgi:hypothetical protein
MKPLPSLLLVLLASCGGASPAPTKPPVTNTPAPAPEQPVDVSALDDVTQLHTRACACTNADCAIDAQRDFESWALANDDTKGTPEQAEKAHRLVDETVACIIRASGWESPSGGALPACDHYAGRLWLAQHCGNASQATHDDAAKQLASRRTGWSNAASLSTDARKAADADCTQWDDSLTANEDLMRCPTVAIAR